MAEELWGEDGSVKIFSGGIRMNKFSFIKSILGGIIAGLVILA